MYSSNSFNVCPHCGKANSLNARYCSGCGKQLAVPEEVVVCHKCHKPNSAMASFCGSCGAPLRVGAQTKICPKCHKEVDSSANVCSCGYSFSGVKYASPESEAVEKKADKKAGSRNSALLDPRHKGARAIAVFSLIVLLLFAYIIMVPHQGRPAFLQKIDLGIFTRANDDASLPFYGFNLVHGPLSSWLGKGGSFSAMKGYYGIGGMLWAVLTTILALTMVIQLIAVIGQLVSAKRHKKANLFHLIMAILTTLCLALLWIAYFLVSKGKGGNGAKKMLDVFMPNSKDWNFSLGRVIYFIPVYYWLCFLFSWMFKQKKIKEKAA